MLVQSSRLARALPPRARVLARASSHARRSSIPRAAATNEAPASEASWEAATALFSDESLRDLESLRARFAAADVDGSGYIDSAELRTVLESSDGGRACSLEHWLTEEDVAAVMSAHDADGDGRLSREEFEAMISTDGLLLRGSLSDYEAAFDAVDSNADGCISATELADLLRALGKPVSYDDLVSTMRSFDVDESGRLEFYEVLRMFRGAVLDLDEVLDYIRLTPTRRGAAEDAAEHARRRKAAAVAAGRDGAAVSSPTDVEAEDASLVASVYSAEELDALLDERGGAPTVLMASVTWCRPCRALARPYSLLAERYPSCRFVRLYGNASDDAKALFRDRLKVRVTPTFFVFGSAKDGEPTTVLHSHTGANKAKLEHAVREAVAARGGDVGGPPVYPPEQKKTGGW